MCLLLEETFSLMLLEDNLSLSDTNCYTLKTLFPDCCYKKTLFLQPILIVIPRRLSKIHDD